MNPDKIGKFINKLRIEKKLSQYQLADMIPITRQAVSKWERGQTIPDSSTLLKLSEIFDVTINELLTGEREETKSIEKLEKTTLNILDESNKKTKKIRKIGISFLITTLFLILAFLSYYFISSYNSIKVYTISSNNQLFDIYDGIFITTKQKSYLKIGRVKTKDNSKIEKIKVYYKKGKEEILLLEDVDIDRTIINHYGYNETFNQKDINVLLKNTYMEIKYNENNIEKIKIKFKRDFTNDNFIFEKEHTITTVKEKEKQEEITEIEKAISYIKNKGEFDKNMHSYTYTIEEDSSNIKFRYLEELRIIRMFKNEEIIWDYHVEKNISICNIENEKQPEEKVCRETIQENINQYLIGGGN